MQKIVIVAFILILFSTAFAQTGVNTETPHAKTELQVVSVSNNTGVLIPRMPTASITAIASPATGLLVYSTDNNTFFFYNGTAWKRIGESCTIIEDTDMDTRVEADNGADNDAVSFTAAGTLVVVIDKNGIVQNMGDLVKTNGSVTINNDYTLPAVDGIDNDVLVTNGSGTLTWKDPTTLPGLVAGVVTFPLVSGREMFSLQQKAWYTAIIPWSQITVNKISFYANITGSPIIEIGIYDETNALVAFGTQTFTTNGLQFCTVALSVAIKLKAGKIYRIGFLEKDDTASTFLENPNYAASGIHWTKFMPATRSLPASIVGASTGQKPLWLCLY